TGELIPWLAKSFEYSQDFKVVTVNLQKEVKWNDGVPFTADDVVFTYNDLYLNPAYEGTFFAPARAAAIDRVEKIDNYTVRFILKAAYPRFHINVNLFPTSVAWWATEILPKHIWQGVNVTEYKNYPPVGTGAYKVKEVGPTFIVYERRDDWWATEVFGIRPGPKYVVCQFYGSEDETALRMEANEVDYCIFGILSYGSAEKVCKENPEVMLWSRATPYTWVDPCPRALFLNNLKYPWNLPEVRRALSYMIDREMLVSLGYEGTTVSTPYFYPPYGALQPYLETIQDVIEKYEPDVYDLTKAESLLKGAGFSKGTDGVWVSPNGTRLAAEVITWLGHIELMRATQVLVEQLRAAGVDVTYKPVATSTYFEITSNGQYDMAYVWLCPGDTDPLSNLLLFHSRNSYAPIGESTEIFEACHRYNNSELDKIIEELEVTSPIANPDKCKQLFRNAMEILYRDLPVIPLCQTPAVLPFNSHYWVGWPSADNPWIHPLIWATHGVIALTGYQSTITGEWVGGIRPKTITYTTVYFTKDTPRFRGIDLVWY
ncbi:ABC transporter substrate-binding protein, partial [Candidatus Bathyarchaeota archaeon]|nr:ABC transporter substrate-binding protein [Candidatus Bathyarchaeota archaeon]